MINKADIFLTDDKFEEIFGTSITSIVRQVSESGSDDCLACKGKCCREIQCRLYSPYFNRCPIFDIRPRECRYHFCNKILSESRLSRATMDLLMKPVQELLGGKKGNIARLFCGFPDFPLDPQGLALLGISDKVNEVISALETGTLSQDRASQLLKNLCLGI